MVAEAAVQSLEEVVEEELLRQEAEAAAERRIDLGLLHVSSDLVLESDLHSTVGTRRHSCNTLVLYSTKSAQADLLSVSSICGIGIGAIIVLSILSSIVGCALLVAGCWGGAVRGTRFRVISVIRVVRIVVRSAMRSVVRSPVVMVVAITATVIVIARRPGLEFLVLLLDIGNQVFAELLGFGDHIGIRSSRIKVSNANRGGKDFRYGYIRNMKEHVLVAFAICGSLQIA